MISAGALLVIVPVVGGLASGVSYWLGRRHRGVAHPAPPTLVTDTPAGLRRLTGRYAIWQDGAVVWQSDPSSPALEAVRAKQAWERARGNVTFYDNGIRRDSK